jgi:hypothetical protein
MMGGLPGSPAHGEHPKFTLLVRRGSDCQHVLIEFSPSTGTAVGQRWSDLLIAEHLAHELLNRNGIATARSEIHQFGAVTFLQMRRFDRKGLDGRIGVTALHSIDTTRYGVLDNLGRICRSTASRSAHRRSNNGTHSTGVYIRRPDRHFGNLGMLDRPDR